MRLDPHEDTERVGLARVLEGVDELHEALSAPGY